jgi:hypothetical protein
MWAEATKRKRSTETVLIVLDLLFNQCLERRTHIGSQAGMPWSPHSDWLLARSFHEFERLQHAAQELFLQRQQSQPSVNRIDGNDGTSRKLGLCLVNCGYHRCVDLIRIEVLGPDLNDGGFGVLRECKNCTEIEIVGKYNGVCPNSPRHDFFVARRRADFDAVHCVETRSLEMRNPSRGKFIPTTIFMRPREQPRDRRRATRHNAALVGCRRALDRDSRPRLDRLYNRNQSCPRSHRQ